MEKVGTNKLAELKLAKEKLKSKELEKTASAQDKKQMEIINKEIKDLESAS